MPELTPLEKMQKDFDDEVRLTTAHNTPVEPDRASRVLTVAAKTGIPLDLIDADLDNLETDMRKQDFSVDDWYKDSRKFADFAAENPYHLAVLKRDQENLTGFERNWKAISLGWDSTWAQVESNKIGNRRADGDFREGDEERLAELGKMQQSHDFGADNWFARSVVWTAKNLGPTISLVGGAFDEAAIGTTSGAALGAGLGAAATPYALGGGAVPGAALGATTGFGVGFTTGLAKGGYEMATGESYNRYTELGFSHENASIMAKSVGVIGGTIEAIPVGKFLKYVPGVGKLTNATGNMLADRLITEVTQKQSVQRATGTLVARYGELMGTEIVTEIYQDGVITVGQNMLSSIESRPDAHVAWDEYVDSVGETIVETAKATIYLSAAGPSMSYAGDIARARRAKQMEAVFRALGDNAKDSNVRKDVPETYKGFVDKVTEGGPIETILIDAERFDEYYQENGQDPDTVAEQLGIENMEEAREIGGDVEIPVSSYASQIAPTKAHNDLVMDIKTDSDQMSSREADLFEANKPEIIEEMESLSETLTSEHADLQGDAIINDVTNQLVGAGFEQGAATNLAQVMRGIPNLAKTMGMDPQVLYDEVFGGVQRSTSEALAPPGDLDIAIDPLIERLRTGDMPKQREMRGPSLMEFMRDSGGVKDDGGELSARDFGGTQPGLLNNKGGASLDDMAERAAESGFIAERDEGLLLEAIDRELAGEPVFGSDFVVDEGLQELDAQLESLGDLIDQSGVDLDTMNNAEVRAALEAMDEFSQSDIEELTQLLGAMDRAETEAGLQANEVEGILAKATELMPHIFQQQDFGEVQFAATVRHRRTGQLVKVTQPAQVVFDRAIKRRNVLQKLKDCLSG